jgi:hypothetical protein
MEARTDAGASATVGGITPDWSEKKEKMKMVHSTTWYIVRYPLRKSCLTEGASWAVGEDLLGEPNYGEGRWGHFQMSQAQHLVKKKWRYASNSLKEGAAWHARKWPLSKQVYTNSLKEGAMWHICPVQGSDH